MPTSSNNDQQQGGQGQTSGGGPNDWPWGTRLDDEAKRGIETPDDE